MFKASKKGYGKRGRPSRKTIKKRYRGDGAIRRVQQSIANKTYVFKRYCSSISFAQSASAGMTASLPAGTLFNLSNVAAGPGTSGYYSIALSHCVSNLSNSSEFLSLFDQYKILGVKVTFFPLANSTSLGDASSTTDTSCIVYRCLDFDDQTQYAASNAGVDDMKQHSNFKRTIGTKPFSFYYKPRILLKSDVAAGSQNVINQRAQWIDCANPDVLHYGSKYIFQVFSSSASTVAVPFDLQMCYYMAFKGVR